MCYLNVGAIEVPGCFADYLVFCARFDRREQLAGPAGRHMTG